jgi:site-specific recombinase XerD
MAWAANSPVTADQLCHQAAGLVVNSVHSDNSRRAYRRALADFRSWLQANSSSGFNKAVVQQYRSDLERRGLAAPTINLRLSAVRKLAIEAADNGLLAPEIAAGIARVRGTPNRASRAGHWLTRNQAQDLIELPAADSKKGIRDRVILAMLLGCGLCRDELPRVVIDQIRQRDGRWVVADLVGKGGRVRTVPMPSWAKMLTDKWVAAAELTSGPLLRAVRKNDRVVGERISAESIAKIVRGYGIDLHVGITPHDLRRSYAKLAHRGRAPLEQIQLSLGHASIQTTERYLGIRQDLADAPCDHLGLSVSADALGSEEKTGVSAKSSRSG